MYFIYQTTIYTYLARLQFHQAAVYIYLAAGCVVLCCSVLYCVVLCCIVLYCIY